MSTESPPRIGLALAGGGAKGAYHVGALKALAELEVPVHAVSGASIGALNGAIVATSPDLDQAHHNLFNIWNELGSDKVITLSNKAPAFLAMLVGMGTAFRAIPMLSTGVTLATKIADVFDLDVPRLNGQVLDETHLVRLLEACTQPELFRNGLPFYVSVYESGGGVDDLLGVLLSVMHLRNTRESDFLHIQSLSDADMQEALLASAALPVLFRAREVGGAYYTDGGQGDWYGVGGNTPVKPLVDAGCDIVIVVHLCDGSIWDRSQYKNVNVIEIRPRTSIARGHAVADILGFDHQRIDSWMTQGYDDSINILKRVFDTIRMVNRMESSRSRLQGSLDQGSESDRLLADAMKRIR